MPPDESPQWPVIRTSPTSRRQLPSPEPAAHGRVLLARGLTLLGVLGLFCLGVAESDGLPRSLQFFIRSNSAMWGLTCLAAIDVGVRLLWKAAHPGPNWAPARPGRRAETVVLYTRANCPLCEEAAEVLAHYRQWLPAAVEVDIDADPLLQQRYNDSVPVVLIDGRVRFKGHVNEVLLQRFIEGAPIRPNLRER